jgi:outer membrane protein OmpA-like peptidoglycan-associated protein
MAYWPALTAVAASLLLVTGPVQANSVRHYSATLDDSAWQISEQNRLTCEMAHDIPRYGTVRFQSEASKQLNLRMTMDMRQLPDSYGVAAIESVPPRWQPGASSYRIGDMKLYKQFDGELRKQLAWTLLSELEKGRYPTFFYEDWYNHRDKVAVSLSAVNFRGTYDDFLDCVSALLPFSFDDIAYTVLNHEADTEKLTLSSQRKLKQISDYLKVDNDLELVLVDAYTDSLGARGPNRELTKRRAEEIQQFFVDRGIQAERIKTVAHGEDRPIQSSDNELNRQINRRVIVQLSKPSPIEL